MKKLALVSLLGVALAAMAYVYLDQDEHQLADTPVALTDAIPGSLTEPKPIPVPAIPTSPPDSVEFQIDRDRLYDLSYLTDPGLAAYADSLDVSPACVVAIERGEADIDDRPVCEHISIEAHTLRPDNGIEYHRLPMEQLMLMADSDPYANQAIGVYYINNAEPDRATPYLERATALSGKAVPVMYIRQTDVHPDVLQYELLLVAEALGRKSQPIARFLAINGLSQDQLTEARQRAETRVERLTTMRQDLVGEPWPLRPKDGQ